MSLINTSKQKTKSTNQSGGNYRGLSIRGNAITFFAVFLGVTFGVVSAMSLVMPKARSAIAADVTNLGRAVDFRTAANTTGTSCSTPTGSGSNVSGSTTKAVVGAGMGLLAPAPILTPATQQISKIVSGVFGNQTGSISNTGPGSTNKVDISNKVTTTVTNTNNISATNSNTQNSTTGNAKVSNNTTGGSASTGSSTNNSNYDYTFNLNN